jgi:hypothetical protein
VHVCVCTRFKGTARELCCAVPRDTPVSTQVSRALKHLAKDTGSFLPDRMDVLELPQSTKWDVYMELKEQ